MSVRVEIRRNGDSRAMVVLLHGWYDASERYNDLIDAIMALEPNADLYLPGYREGFARNENPFQIASEVETIIHERYEERKLSGRPYEYILLIGYSLGALLLRKAYVYGRGSVEDRPDYLRQAPHEWTTRVRRIVLLAGINRGWSLDTRPSDMSVLRYIGLRYLVTPLARLLPILGMLEQLERGAPFVVNLRIQWIRLAQRENETTAPVVQLLGTVDSLVSASDDRDLYVHWGFIFIPVEGADHQSLIRFDESDLGRRCSGKFKEALTADLDDLRARYAADQHITRALMDERQRLIVFVLHGIRDYGGWTGELREEIGRMATQLQQPVPKVVTAKYDFFSMGRFLISRFLPLRPRHKYVRWFMDQYTEQLATFPNKESRVSFVGHSNGTYLLASALKQYQTLTIERACFAGSVVPREFPWEEYITRQGRLQALRNDLAASDWVVGLFPKLFDQLNLSDVGSGGFDGFNDDVANQFENGDYYIGGHGAAIQPANYESLARFILTGEVKREQRLITKAQPLWLVILSRASLLVWITVFVVAFGPPIYFMMHGNFVAALACILFVLFVTSYI